CATAVVRCGAIRPWPRARATWATERPVTANLRGGHASFTKLPAKRAILGGDKRTKGGRTPMNAQIAGPTESAPFPQARRATGRADIHFHLLPGIDDGPVTIDESLDLAVHAALEGTRTIVATP